MAFVTSETLAKRINRKLRPDDKQLRRTRGQSARLDLGEWYVHDTRRNLALQTRVDPEDMAREYEVLRPGEQVAQ